MSNLASLLHSQHIPPAPDRAHTHTRTLIIICRLDPDPDSSRYIFRYPSVNNSFSSHSCWRSSHESLAKLTPHRGEEGKFWGRAAGKCLPAAPKGDKGFFLWILDSPKGFALLRRSWFASKLESVFAPYLAFWYCFYCIFQSGIPYTI